MQDFDKCQDENLLFCTKLDIPIIKIKNLLCVCICIYMYMVELQEAEKPIFAIIDTM